MTRHPHAQAAGFSAVDESSELAAARLAAIVQSSQDAIISKDLNGIITSWNTGAEKIFGYQESEMLGVSILKLIPEDRWAEERLILEKIVAGQRVEHFETERRAKDGRRIHLSVTVSPVRDSRGRIVGASKVARDVTDRKTAEEALKTSEELFAKVFRLSPDCVALVRLSDRTVMEANAAICRLWGRTPEDVIGKPTRDYSTWLSKEERMAFMARLEADGECLDYRTTLRLADGRLVRFDISSRLMTLHGERCIMSVMRDVTDREEAAAALRASELRLRSTLDQILEGCQIISRDWRYLYLNDLGAQHARREKPFMLGRTVMECYPGIELTPIFVTLRECMEQRTSKRILNEFSYEDGTKSWFELSIEPAPEGILVLSLDVTERRRAEEKVLELNSELERRVVERTSQLEAANNELEAFSYSVSHDLRAPLRAMDGFSQAVIEDYSPNLPETGQRYLLTIRKAAQRMGVLIDDLLTFSRLSRLPLNRRKIDTLALAHLALSELGVSLTESGIELRFGDLPTCEGDPSLLQQVWVNLLSNAIKYSRKRPSAMIEIGSFRRSDTDVFFVRDNGTGFDMRHADKLFGVFQRLHRTEDFEGTGVGLAIVQRVIHRHRGEVWAEAEENVGAVFYFTLWSEAAA
ncbi:MAG: PAS domain S-box protein [Opitutus sp.]